jgi:hypothetical protein
LLLSSSSSSCAFLSSGVRGIGLPALWLAGQKKGIEAQYVGPRMHTRTSSLRAVRGRSPIIDRGSATVNLNHVSNAAGSLLTLRSRNSTLAPPKSQKIWVRFFCFKASLFI